MKTKSILNVILILYCIAGLTLFTHAADNNNVAVKDVEYLKGDDFVQLYFKINKMIPIPDVFYPDKKDNTRIIMRLSNTTFQLGKNLLTFDSSVIHSVKIDNGKQFTDVEIKLKEQVNYRVFTNRKGLYIEFPNVKKFLAKDKDKKNKENKPVLAKNNPPQNKPKANTQDKKKNKPWMLPAEKKNYKFPELPNDSDPLPAKKEEVAKEGNPVQLKDIILRHKNDTMVSFDVIMSKPTDFSIIPIPQSPARLAIDFKNTRSKQIKKFVDQLNVKKVRGAYNSDSVYRVVFDLHYLKNYKVSPKNGNKKILEVTFFNNKLQNPVQHHALNVKNKPAPVKKKAAKTAKKAANKKNQQKTAIEKVPVKKNAGPVKINPADFIARKDEPTTKKSKAEKKGRKNKKQAQLMARANTINAPASPLQLGKENNANSANGIVVTKNEKGVQLRDIPSKDRNRGIEQVSTPPKNTIKAQTPTVAPVQNKVSANDGTVPEDFFGEEKSQVNQTTPGQTTTTTAGSQQNLSQINFLNRTIAGGKRQYIGDPMGFNFHNADLKDVIKIIAKISGLNIVIDPGVSGRVTAQLSQVPWDQALELFLKQNGLDMIQEGNILRIGSVDKLAAEAARRRALRDARQMEDDLEVFTKTLSFAKVNEVSAILKKQLSKRGGILQDVRTNTLIISEIPGKIVEMKKLIEVLDTANPQVSIEARIVETNANFIESFGIQWGYNFIADASHGNQTTLKFPNSISSYGTQYTSESSPLLGPLGGYAVNLPATGATSGTVFSLGNIANTFRLDMALSAMQTKGQGRIISAPKTTTQNNMEAIIMQGKQIPVQTIQNNTVTVIYRPAALELKVTPQITADGTVVTQLEINNNSADFANLVNGIPPITTQSINTTVMVPDGGTIVIGGMYKVEKTTTKQGIPVLSKIPLLGNLFKSSAKRSEQKELLIFITPRIIK
jgi:type IV pilus assembly protein PilQ